MLALACIIAVTSWQQVSPSKSPFVELFLVAGFPAAAGIVVASGMARGGQQIDEREVHVGDSGRPGDEMARGPGQLAEDAALALLRREGVGIPYPQRVVRFQGALQAEVAPPVTAPAAESAR